MRVLMLTNTYLPTISGVAESVDRFAWAVRRRGHRVLIVAPEADDAPAWERDVVRAPALQHFNGSDFSVQVPAPRFLRSRIDEFRPQLVHTHHPFLLGDTGLRIAMTRRAPLLFTHHTLYEKYTHYVPGDSPTMQRFAAELSTEYANLCHRVIAPSESIAEVFRKRGVKTPITVIPTGIDPERFRPGDRGSACRRFGIDPGRRVIGHVGRLAPEKNLDFLEKSILRLMTARSDTTFLLVGDGPSRRSIQTRFRDHRLASRLVWAGALGGEDLVEAYRAMDVFAFASKTETQGVVLAEAMGCGVPAVALDAVGVRDLVDEGVNGRLVGTQSVGPFAEALRQVLYQSAADLQKMRAAARRRAEAMSMERCARRLLGVYREMLTTKAVFTEGYDSQWNQVQRRIAAERDLWVGRATAAVRVWSA